MQTEKTSWKNRLYYLLPVLGTLFYIWYILAATEDVVYTDYIRLINSYLPDVWNPKKFFVADIFTRMPVNYLERIINVTLFDYSTTFEMVLGALCTGAAALVLASYCRRRQISFLWYLPLMVVFFSLNKWEMITNGTGWCHFLAFAGFYLHFVVWERVWERQMQGGGTSGMSDSAHLAEAMPESRKVGFAGLQARRNAQAQRDAQACQDAKDRRLLKLLPWLIILGTGGPYGAAYAAILILTYGFCFLLDRRQKGRPDFRHIVYGLHVLAPMLLYLLSNAFAETEHAGATGRSIFQVLGDNVTLFPKFLIKSFSSLVIGEEPLMELLTKMDRGMVLCYLLGLLVLFGYLLALWMQLRRRLYRISIFPLMLIFWGGLNHLLVLAARWIFENSDYGMSSRYALQYQVGILGILLTFGLAWKAWKERGRARAEVTAPQNAGVTAPQNAGVTAPQNAETAARRDSGANSRTAPSFPLWQRTLALAFCLVILAGNGYTTAMEIKKAPSREDYARGVREIALHYKEAPDDELESRMQYHHGPELIRSALSILEEEKWNIFGGEIE